jgi:hypothetical protein
MLGCASHNMSFYIEGRNTFDTSAFKSAASEKCGAFPPLFLPMHACHRESGSHPLFSSVSAGAFITVSLRTTMQFAAALLPFRMLPIRVFI